MRGTAWLVSRSAASACAVLTSMADAFEKELDALGELPKTVPSEVEGTELVNWVKYEQMAAVVQGWRALCQHEWYSFDLDPTLLHLLRYCACTLGKK